MIKKINIYMWVVLAVELLFVSFFLLNYDLTWMNPEKYNVSEWILSNGSSWKAEDWGKFLNTKVIECDADRMSRPISNFVEVLNTKLRANLWKNFLPHPSLSLLWPIMFFVLPLYLYRIFRNLNCSRDVSFAGVCIYLVSSGFLSGITMLFHPAKNLVNLFGVLSLYMFSRKYKQLPKLQYHGFDWNCFFGFLFLYLGFISDETGLFVYLIVIAFFYRLWLQFFKDRQFVVLSGFLALPILYYLTITKFLPWIHWLVNKEKVVLSNFTCYPKLSDLLWPNWGNLLHNSKLLFADHPHWIINYGVLAKHPVLLLNQLLYLAVCGVVVFLLVKVIKSWLLNKDPKNSGFIYLIAIGIALLVVYCFFHTFQLSHNSAKVWGIWWYGNLFSLIFVFISVFIFQLLSLRYSWFKGLILALITLVFVMNVAVFTTYRIALLKRQNINRELLNFEKAFDLNEDLYSLYNFKDALNRSNCTKMYTKSLWLTWKGSNSDIDQGQLNFCNNLMSEKMVVQFSPYQPATSVPIHALYLVYLQKELK